MLIIIIINTDRQHQVVQQELGNHDGPARMGRRERIRIHGNVVQKARRKIPWSSAFDQLLHPSDCHQIQDQSCRRETGNMLDC